MHCPQSPLPSNFPSEAYPSPRSKSPPPGPASKFLRKLPRFKYPLMDITNTAPMLELPPHGREGGGPALSGDAPARRGRGRSRRGQLRATHAHGGGLLRSPIPLGSLSPRSFPRTSFSFRFSNLVHAASPSPESPPAAQPPSHTPRLCNASAPETPPRSLKWVTLQLSVAGRIALRSPLSPNPRTPRARKYRLRNPASPPPPPMSPTPPMPCPISVQQSLPLPDPNAAQGQKKRTKRELAELLWQVTVHRSLAWSVRTRAVSSMGQYGERLDGEDISGGCIEDDLAESVCVQEVMNIHHGGLMIVLGPAKVADGTGRQIPHWTDPIDRDLVGRLWERLIAQGCMPVDSAAHVTSTPENSMPPAGIPFPTTSDGLAPAIQLSSSPEAEPEPRNMSFPRGPRRRVSAVTSLPPSFVTRLSVSSAGPRPLTARPPSCNVSLPPPPKGTLTPVQLAAQIRLRRSRATAKSIKRGRTMYSAPGCSGLGISLDD